MKYYQELTILPSEEVPVNFIWSRVYAKIHIALVEEQKGEPKGRIGVSFPRYRYDGQYRELGNKLRIFAATEQELEDLAIKKYLKRYDDYVHITRVRKVPTTTRYACYRRKHAESGRLQKAKRYIKRHGGSLDEALAVFPADDFKNLPPFIQLKSYSNQQPFCLYIAKEARNEEIDEGFSAYGLDQHSTVPEF